MEIRAAFLGFIGMLFLVSCATQQDFDTQEPFSFPDTTTAISPADLRIGPMDSISVTVFGVEDLNGTYQVDFSGKLKLPLIDDLNVVGMTANELAYELQQRYGESYLQDPDVSVTISESVSRQVTLEGSIRNPGLYPISGNLSLIQAVALGGGPAEGANPRKVVVFRQINGERHAAAFNLLSIRRGESDDPPIYGNDVIVVDGSEARQTYGELLRSMPLIALFMAF